MSIFDSEKSRFDVGLRVLVYLKKTQKYINIVMCDYYYVEITIHI